MYAVDDLMPVRLRLRGFILASAFLLSGCATNGDMSTTWECLKKETRQGANTYRLDLNTYTRVNHCVQIESEVAQRRSAEQAEKDYRAQNKGKLPEMASVIYSTKMTPLDGIVKKGGVLTLVGHVEVVGGTNQKINSLKEELVLSYNGEKMQSVVKPMSGSGGIFETKHLVSIPPQFQDGRYTITSRVLINGSVVPSTTQKHKLDVVRLESHFHLALMAGSD